MGRCQGDASAAGLFRAIARQLEAVVFEQGGDRQLHFILGQGLSHASPSPIAKAGLFHVSESKTSFGLFAKNRFAFVMEEKPLFLAKLTKMFRMKDQLAGLSPVRWRALSSPSTTSLGQCN